MQRCWLQPSHAGTPPARGDLIRCLELVLSSTPAKLMSEHNCHPATMYTRGTSTMWKIETVERITRSTTPPSHNSTPFNSRPKCFLIVDTDAAFLGAFLVLLLLRCLSSHLRPLCPEVLGIAKPLHFSAHERMFQHDASATTLHEVYAGVHALLHNPFIS